MESQKQDKINNKNDNIKTKQKEDKIKRLKINLNSDLEDSKNLPKLGLYSTPNKISKHLKNNFKSSDTFYEDLLETYQISNKISIKTKIKKLRFKKPKNSVDFGRSSEITDISTNSNQIHNSPNKIDRFVKLYKNDNINNNINPIVNNKATEKVNLELPKLISNNIQLSKDNSTKALTFNIKKLKDSNISIKTTFKVSNQNNFSLLAKNKPKQIKVINNMDFTIKKLDHSEMTMITKNINLDIEKINKPKRCLFGCF